MMPPTNTNALLALKIQRGFYMGGIISPDQRACKCSGRFIKKTFRGANYFSCDKCDTDPAFFRVRRYLPGPFGEKGKTVEIRYDSNGKRLTSIAAAHATMEYIDGLVSNNKFDPSQFMIREAHNMLLFKNFVEKKYLPIFDKMLERKEIKKATMISKRGIIKLHLMPFFANKNISEIGSLTISEFIETGTFSSAYKRLIMGELKTILRKAVELELINRAPHFGKEKKPALKDPEKFLTFEEQMRVVELIDNEQYRIMIRILCVLAIRPSEVRAIKWNDWDFKGRKLWIRNHVTCGSIETGRKSNEDAHSIIVPQDLIDTLSSIPTPINKNSLMFKGKKGEFVSDNCLYRAWKRAINLSGLPYVDLYRGTKSSRLSQWLRDGFTKSEISTVVGISESVVGRYAQHDTESRDKIQDKINKGKG
jgi:integrase